MTNAEYIRWLKLLDEELTFDALVDGKDEMDMHEMIFELCTKLEQEPCEDCISRQSVVDTALNSKSSFKNDFACGFFIDEIRELPTVTPKEKSEYEHDHEMVKAYNDGQAYILDKIKAEIENDWQFKQFPRSPWSCGLRRAIEIIDKYRQEG